MSIHGVMLEWSEKPFSYGEDCCQFAAAVVEAITGHNPMRSFVYESERQALRVIARYGGLRQAIIATLGSPIPVADARDGDVLLVDSTSGPAAAVCFKGRAIVRTPNGIMDWPLETASDAWKTRNG